MKSKNHYDTILRIIAENIQNFDVLEIELFFKAFLTPSEVIELCDRIEIAKGLVSGKTQRQIAEEVGASVSKVTAGSREFQFGAGKEIFKKFNV